MGFLALAKAKSYRESHLDCWGTDNVLPKDPSKKQGISSYDIQIGWILPGQSMEAQFFFNSCTNSL